MKIKIVKKENLNEALGLIWETFIDSILPLYTNPSGKETFLETLKSDLTLNHTEFFGYFQGEKLLGVIAVSEKRSHICYFFTHKYYKGKGVGKILFNYLLDNTESNFITVNASPYATEIYHKLGFKDLDKLQENKGMLFTPMKYTKEKTLDF